MELLENEVELVTEVCTWIKVEEERLKPRRLRVLDLGCGTGKFAIYLQEATGCEVIGIDPVRAKIERAWSRSSSVSFAVQSAEVLAFANHTFDILVSLKVLHELPNYARAMKESNRVLKAGGKIFIIDWIAGAARTGSHAHAHRYFSQDRLQEVLSEAGFSAIRIVTNKEEELMLGEGVKRE